MNRKLTLIADTDKYPLAATLGCSYRFFNRKLLTAVDLNNIIAIKFEFGSLTAGNSSGAAIFLKDIYVAKARRSRWL